MKMIDLIPRFLLREDVKRCGNCRHNQDYCYIKEIENPCIFHEPHITLAKRAKLYKIITKDINRHNKRIDKLVKRARKILNA